MIGGLIGVAALVESVFGNASAQAATLQSPSAASIPPGWLKLVKDAGSTCNSPAKMQPPIWAILAAIAYVESDFDLNPNPSIHTGGKNPEGVLALGPMQFEPDTFAIYDQPIPDDPWPTPPATDYPSFAIDPVTGAPFAGPIFDPIDSVFAAARDLCANGLRTGWVDQAIFTYNHSQSYVAKVRAYAAAFSSSGGAPGVAQAPPGSPTQVLAAQIAESYLGTPYVWGGASPQAGGFDCSGLTYFSFASAGFAIPRGGQAQFNFGPDHITDPSQLVIGDLVFFGSLPNVDDHVGIFVGFAANGDGVMVDAPHTGASVRYDQFVPIVGAYWGSEAYLGATDPGATI